MQTPRVTQIQVRVDCNGCVQKIKKALNGINGIHNLHVDFRRQRLTIIGWADPEKIVKAIKKTKKNATICSNIELTSPSKPTQPESQGNAPAPDAAQPSPAEPPHQQPPPETTPSTTPNEHNASQQWQRNPGTNMIYHNLPNYVNRFSSGHHYVEHLDSNHNSPVFLHEPSQSMYVAHSYNTYMPSPYVTEYECVRSPSRHTHYNRMEHYSGDYQNGNVDFTSMFSDDNPNACSIV
ncbi:uncharacterized protein LOC133294549 [Gastrolobium bilobum]|uniref:uncharacterized protein LOC133294549 n=1 Tax=Gastrolobium bilobum TaxID=150636 RepID=UPI002AB19ACE|nr:uncharacterized protein LOC133294549 [Gastrolobium bilobum]